MRDSGRFVVPYQGRGPWGNSGLVGTAGAVATWAGALFRRRVILSARSLAQMTKFRETPEGYEHGVGTMRMDHRDHVSWGHNGVLGGFWAHMWYDPEDGITVVVLGNRGGRGYDSPLIDSHLLAIARRNR